MSEMPSSEEDLDNYCHRLYQEKVSFIALFFTEILAALCRTNCYVNFMRKEDLTVMSMNGREDYGGRYYHTSMHCFGVVCLCFLPAYLC